MDDEPNDPVTVERDILLTVVGMLWASGYRNPTVYRTAAYLARRAGAEAFAKHIDNERTSE